jgi:hypothetical protein
MLAFVLSICVVAYAGTYRGEIASADEAYMFAVTHNLAESHSMAIDDLRWLNDRVPGARIGPDGRLYSKLGVGQSLLGLPAYLLGKRYGPDGGAQFAGYPIGPISGVRGAMAVGSALALVTVVATYAIATMLGAGPRGAALGALGTGVGSMLWVYAKTYFSEPAAACLLTCVVALVVWHGRRPALLKALVAGLLLIVCVLVRPFNLAAAVPIDIFVLWIAISTGLARRAAVSGSLVLIACTLVAAGGVLLYNNLRFGSPFITGYGANENFQHDVVQGLLGYAVSPGKSIVLFDPLVILAPVGPVLIWLRGASGSAAQPVRASSQPSVAVTLLISGIIAVYVFIYSAWWAWEGGWAWGPRFLLPIVPLCMALSAVALGATPRLIGATLLIVTGVVQVAGSLYDPITSIGEVIGGGLPEAQYPWSRDRAYALVQALHVLHGEKPDSLFFAHHVVGPPWLLLSALIVVGALVVAFGSAGRSAATPSITRFQERPSA